MPVIEQFHQSFIRLTGKHMQTLAFYWSSFDMTCPVCLECCQLRDLAMQEILYSEGGAQAQAAQGSYECPIPSSV